MGIYRGPKYPRTACTHVHNSSVRARCSTHAHSTRDVHDLYLRRVSRLRLAFAASLPAGSCGRLTRPFRSTAQLTTQFCQWGALMRRCDDDDDDAALWQRQYGNGVVVREPRRRAVVASMQIASRLLSTPPPPRKYTEKLRRRIPRARHNRVVYDRGKRACVHCAHDRLAANKRRPICLGGGVGTVYRWPRLPSQPSTLADSGRVPVFGRVGASERAVACVCNARGTIIIWLIKRCGAQTSQISRHRVFETPGTNKWKITSFVRRIHIRYIFRRTHWR